MACYNQCECYMWPALVAVLVQAGDHFLLCDSVLYCVGVAVTVRVATVERVLCSCMNSVQVTGRAGHRLPLSATTLVTALLQMPQAQVA
jgi:hypothetical protein